jgi:hypothetical protein
MIPFVAETSEKRDWLAKISGVPKSIANVLRSTGPFLIAQSEKASGAYARHEMRLAGVEAAKELLHEEIKTLSGVRREVLERYYRTADPLERIRLKRDLEEITGELRHLNIGQKPLTSAEIDKTTEKSTREATTDVSAHWMDKFNELARSCNEPWREDLLARALAKEATSPGSVVPRALWLLGTLEESVFNRFAKLLDLSSVVRIGLMIPTNSQSFLTKPIPGESGVAIGNLLYQLEEVGLVADATSSYRTLHKGGPYLVRYRDLNAYVECPEKEYKVRGIIFTTIGNAIASFYEQKDNPMGREIYEDFLKQLEASSCKVRRPS